MTSIFIFSAQVIYKEYSLYADSVAQGRIIMKMEGVCFGLKALHGGRRLTISRERRVAFIDRVARGGKQLGQQAAPSWTSNLF